MTQRRVNLRAQGKASVQNIPPPFGDSVFLTCAGRDVAAAKDASGHLYHRQCPVEVDNNLSEIQVLFAEVTTRQ